MKNLAKIIVKCHIAKGIVVSVENERLKCLLGRKYEKTLSYGIMQFQIAWNNFVAKLFIATFSLKGY